MNMKSRIVKNWKEFPFPVKMSNLKVAVLEQEKKGNVQCSRCFPHGVDQKNNRQSKVQRSWKEQRKKQYKILR